MKINLGAIKDRIPKKIIMPLASALLFVLVMIIFVSVLKSCFQTKHSNKIDLDLIETDGTINQKKIFQELEDVEKRTPYRRKDSF
ncbi:MAG: hypothetical protein FWG13_05190 [Leptospirales bacterium]|nr:hypothetical protein [Leptospirales bacterium]